MYDFVLPCALKMTPYFPSPLRSFGPLVRPPDASALLAEKAPEWGWVIKCGFPDMGVPQSIDGLEWKIPLKYDRKPPNTWYGSNLLTPMLQHDKQLRKGQYVVWYIGAKAI